MSKNEQDLVQITKDYYDSTDADNFYYLVWGGEDLHLGIYDSPSDSIFDASRRTVQRMAEFSKLLGPDVRVLDIGGGFGGSVRYLAKTYGCRATCLNLSLKENERGRRMNEEQGLDHLVDIVDGSFEDLDFPDESFDIIWSQDAILHSNRRERVLQEAVRVLKPGGEFIFTDPMKADDCPEGVLDPILERIHLQTLGSPAFYQDTARKLGLEVVLVEDQTPNLTRHYTRVLEETTRKRPELEGRVSDAYLDRMESGLQRWIEGGEKGYLAWCIFYFRKPQSQDSKS